MRRLMSITFGAALVAAALVGTVAPAQASVTATVSPESGVYTGTTDVLTSGFCPDGDKYVQVFINGSGFAANYPVIGITETSTAQFGSGYKLPLSDTLKTLAADQSPPATFSGQYILKVMCYEDFGMSGTTLTTVPIWFTDATHYQSDNPSKGVETSTAVEVSPASALVGEQVTLTATLTPSSATGSVTFYAKAGTNDPINLGERTVSSGTAVLRTSALEGGTAPVVARTYKIYATFSPDGEDFFESTSNLDAVTVTITTPLTPTPLVAPSLPSSVKVGTEVSCSLGTWQYALQYAVTIKVGTSTKASRAKGTSPLPLKYTPVAQDAGKDLSCTVIAYNTVYNTSTTRSVSRSVAASSLTVTNAPKISGTLKVGKTVSVTEGTWSPSAASVSFVWGTIKNGTLTPIAGLTSKSVTIPNSAAGKVFGVTVTARKGDLTGRTTITAGPIK